MGKKLIIKPNSKNFIEDRSNFHISSAMISNVNAMTGKSITNGVILTSRKRLIKSGSVGMATKKLRVPTIFSANLQLPITFQSMKYINESIEIHEIAK